MQERYGLTGRPVGRRIAVGLLLLAFVGILAFVTFGVTRNPIESRLVSWDAAPDHVVITIAVTRPPEAEVTCVVRAQDENRVDLGYATVVLPPGDGDVLLDYALRTLAPAYTAEQPSSSAG